MTATITSHDRITANANEWDGSDLRVVSRDGQTVGMVRTTMDDGQLTVRVFDGGLESWNVTFSGTNHDTWNAITATINAATATLLAITR